MKKILLIAISISSLAFLNSCDTLKNLPTNTSGGIFSLNGNWKLVSTNEGNAQVGTIVNVTPAIASAFVKSFDNNSYCYKTSDEAWRSINSTGAGGFSINVLVSACNNSSVYKAGQLTVLTNNQIRVNTKSLNNSDLIQEWSRVTN